MFRKLAAVAAVPLLVAACASEAEPGALEVKTGDAAVAALRTAPEAAADAGTAQLEMTLQVPAANEPVELVATGAFDAADRQGRLSMDLSPLVEQMAGQGVLPAGLGRATVDLVFDGDTLYLRSPLFGLFTDTDGWLSASAEEVGDGRFGIGSADPTALLDALRGTGGDPEVVGSEDIRGVPTTHYRASVSLSDALAEVPEADRAQAEAAFGQLGDAATAKVPVDVWVDADDLPRRVRMDMGAAFGALVGGDGPMTMTLDLFGYGEPVTIDVPPADQVTPASEVIPNLGGLLGSGGGS